MKHYRSYNGKRRQNGVKRVFTALLALVLAGVLCFGVLFGVVMTGSRDDINGDCGIMIILGCQVMPAGHPSILLRDRLNTAMDWLEDHPNTVVVVSGGQGANEPTSEARAMADYLVEKGYPEELILLEETSMNTNENLRYSVEVLADEGYDVTENIIVVSNGFHLARVRMLWHRLTGGQDNLSTLAAPSSHMPSRLRMYVREPLALVKSFLFDRGV